MSGGGGKIWGGNIQPSPRLNTSTGAVRKRATLQTPTDDQDMKHLGATKKHCSSHAIDYYVWSGALQSCPLCQNERDYDNLKVELLQAQNALKIAQNQLEKLRPQVDLQAAIRTAIEVLDDADYAWLKTQMYQYKLDKSVSLKPTFGKVAGNKRKPRGDKLPPNGFMTLPRSKSQDPEAHACTSIGGLAMAEYLDEAIHTFGPAQAMGIMLKAWWKALPGGVDE